MDVIVLNIIFSCRKMVKIRVDLMVKLQQFPLLGCSGENLFVDQSNFFLDDYTDRQPSSRNTHQEYSFHLYSGGTSPPK